MAAGSDTTAQTLRPLRRDSRRRALAGVCAGIARYLRVDPLVVRIAFVAAAAAGGIGVVLYVVAWVLMPADGQASGSATELRPRTGRSAIEVALGVGFLLLSALLAFRAAGIWLSDAVVWPLVLVAAGGALIWRQSGGAPSARVEDAAAPRAPAEAEAGAGAIGERAAVISRTGIGIALVVAAGFAFLQATGALSAARDVVLAVIVVIVVLGVIFAPWIVRLARSLSSERAERIRSQERAELAAHLHDSVLQTLALMQKRADDPREVAGLARRQERELRAWLSGRTATSPERSFVAALETAAEDVERARGVRVEVVAVGDCEIDDAAGAVIAAAREAILNAAKFGGGSAVDVYAELGGERIELFIRDRGPGFDLNAVPADRRGVRESIIGRMERNGGSASIHTAPNGGTEVELVLERGRS